MVDQCEFDIRGQYKTLLNKESPLSQLSVVKVILCLLRSFGTLLIAFGSLSNWVVNPLEKQASTELYK